MLTITTGTIDMLTNLMFVLLMALCFARGLAELHFVFIKMDWGKSNLSDKFHKWFTYTKLVFVCALPRLDHELLNDNEYVFGTLSSYLLAWMVIHFVFEVKLNKLRGLHPYYVSYDKNASLTDKAFVKAGKITRLPATIVSKLSKILFTAIALGLYIWLMVA